jgi:hypothetical protein
MRSMALSAAVATPVVDPRSRFIRVLEPPKVSSSIRSLTALLPPIALFARGQEARNYRGALSRSTQSSGFRGGMSDAGRMPLDMFGVKEQSTCARFSWCGLRSPRCACSQGLPQRSARLCEKTSCTRIRRLDADPTTRVSSGPSSLAFSGCPLDGSI